MNESCHIYMNESCRTWARQYFSTPPCLLSAGPSRGWFVSHISASHDTHMNEPWHIWERVILHMWLSHSTRMQKKMCLTSFLYSHARTHTHTHTHTQTHTYTYTHTHTYLYTPCPRPTHMKWYIWMSHVTHMSKSYVWMSHVAHLWICQFIYMNELCHIYMNMSIHMYEWVMSHVRIS